MDDVRQITVRRSDSIHRAIEVLDRAAKGIVLVTDASGRLEATITDGDIRRAILAGQSLIGTVDELARRKLSPQYPRPVTASGDASREDLLEIMQEQRIRHVPIVDDEGRVTGLVTMDMLLPEEPERLQAVVMAGGQGARLRPLTQATPKPMLPVGDRPLLEHIIDQLKGVGIRDITITTNYLAGQIQEHFGDGSRHEVNINYVTESKPLGTAGALSLMEKPRQPVLVINGDVLTSLNFNAMHAFHKEHAPAVTMAVRQYDVHVPYGVVECVGAEVVEVLEKPTVPFFVNAGIYLMEPEVMELIPSNERFDVTDLFTELKKAGKKIAPFLIREYWLDIGRLEDYERANQDLTNGRLA
jgi:dTDP-glucose pyrophosphorylase